MGGKAYGQSYAYGGLVNRALPLEAFPRLPALVALADALAPEFAPYRMALVNWFGLPRASSWPNSTRHAAMLFPCASFNFRLCCCLLLFLLPSPSSSLSTYPHPFHPTSLFFLFSLFCPRRYGPRDSIAAHSDSESQLRPGAPIFSFSWGATRRFVLKGRVVDGLLPTGRRRVEVALRDGDLVIMGGTCQITHKHEIPAPKKSEFASGDRVNATIRSAFVGASEPLA